jgi:hypothetical protein
METSCTLTRVVAKSTTQWTLMQHNTRKRTQSEFRRAAGVISSSMNGQLLRT